MLSDNDKCPNCGCSITWGTDADTVSYCGHMKLIWYTFIMCEGHCGFHLLNWAAVSLSTFTDVIRVLEKDLEREYRAIVERSEHAKRHTVERSEHAKRHTVELFEKLYKEVYHD